MNKYKVGDNVIVFAKIKKIEEDKDGFKYFIHGEHSSQFDNCPVLEQDIKTADEIEEQLRNQADIE